MVDIALLGVGVCDRLIQLLTVDERKREKYFQQFIKPLYKDAESVMNDYVALFTELIELLKKTDSTEEVIAWIEQRRSKMLPLRIKVRALLENNTLDPKKVPAGASRLFVKGLWGVMKGGISLVEVGNAGMPEYGFGDHTVFDLLKKYRGLPVPDDANDIEWYIDKAQRQRERYISHAHCQLLAIESAWKDANKGYAVLKRECLRPA